MVYWLIFVIILSSFYFFIEWLIQIIRYKKYNHFSVIKKRYEEFMGSSVGEKYNIGKFDNEYEDLIISVLDIEDKEYRNRVLEILVEKAEKDKNIKKEVC